MIDGSEERNGWLNLELQSPHVTERRSNVRARVGLKPFCLYIGERKLQKRFMWKAYFRVADPYAQSAPQVTKFLTRQSVIIHSRDYRSLKRTKPPNFGRSKQH